MWGIYEKVCVDSRLWIVHSADAGGVLRVTLFRRPRICSTITHVSTVHHSNVAMMEID